MRNAMMRDVCSCARSLLPLQSQVSATITHSSSPFYKFGNERAPPVSFGRRERVEELARAAISRNRAAVDDDRLKRDEDILGMVLQNRRVEV